MVLGAIAIFMLVRSVGESLVASPPGTSAAAASGGHDQPDALFHILLALGTVLALGRLLGKAGAALGQPPVIGELVAGLVLGPSLLGRFAPAAANEILPEWIGPELGVIAQLGVVVYMFLVGLELNVDVVRKRVHATVVTSHASIIAPFLLGSLIALYLYPRFSLAGVSFTSFALFMGVAMSITAFPVLARILTDRGISKTDLGIVSLTCAAVDDVTAWCLLAVVIGVSRNRLHSTAVVITLTVGFVAAMFMFVGPAVRRFLNTGDRPPTRERIAFTLLALLASALVTERIGIHAIFGAFLLGAVIPPDTALARSLTEKLHDLVTILLLPAYFAFTGMRTRVDLISGSAEWLTLGLIVFVATIGKFGGTLFAGRLTGMQWRSAAALGILMNTRGLMQLVVLNVGLDLNVISPTLYTMMVLMALITTIATTPLLDLLGTDLFHESEVTLATAGNRL